MKQSIFVQIPSPLLAVTVPSNITNTESSQPVVDNFELSEEFEICEPISHEELAANLRTRVGKLSKDDRPFYEGHVPFLLEGLDW